MVEQTKMEKSFIKDVTKKETQLNNSIELNNDRKEVVFTFKNKPIIDFDKTTKKLVYGKEEVEEVKTTYSERKEMLLEKQGYCLEEVSEELQKSINPMIMGLVIVSNARKTKSNFNPFKE